MRNSKSKSNKEVILDNNLITLNKHFKPFEAKILYGLLSIYTYEARVKGNFNRRIQVDTVDVKKMMLGGNVNISIDRYRKRIFSMETNLILENNRRCFESIHIVTGIKVDEDTNKTTFVLNYDICKMANDIGENWAAIKLLELAKLNSAFSIKAYELCTVYKGLSCYHMPIQKFREYFNISNEYATRDIDKRIITPIIKDINELTGFNLQIKKCKKGVKISHYDFYISTKSEDEMLSLNALAMPSAKVEQVTAVAESISCALPPNSPNDDMTATPDYIKWFDELWDKYPKKEGRKSISSETIKKLYADKENVEKALNNYLADKELKINGGWKGIKNGKKFFDNYEDYVKADTVDKSDLGFKFIN
jgi:hypothetical protein